MQYDVEEDFDLAVAPKRADFSAEAGGASRHLMVNGSAERIAIKVKCSNNLRYRILPVHTVLEPGSAQRLEIVRREKGDPGTDKLILLYTRTEGKNAREVFSQTDKSQLKRLLIVLVARSKAPSSMEGGNAAEGGEIPGIDDGEDVEVNDVANQLRLMAQCGGSDGRSGSPGKTSSSIPPRSDTRESSIRLIDDEEEGE